MTIRLVEIHLTDYIELWVGGEINRDGWEFRIEISIWKLWLSLPLRWVKEG